MFKALSRFASSFGSAARAVPMEEPDPIEFPIIVSRSAIDAHPENPGPLVAELVDYVNAMHIRGRYRYDEIPAAALQAFRMDNYFAQVTGGGHAQFLHNCGDSFEATLAEIEAGLTAVDAAEFRVVLHRLAAWREANPDAAASQTGLAGGNDPALAKLDRIFGALDKEFDLHRKIAALVADAAELQPVSDLHVDEAREDLCGRNPERAARDRVLTISEIDHQLTDPFSATLALAAGMTDPFAPITQVDNAGYHEVDGRDRMCFALATEDGARWAVVHDDGIAVHDRGGAGGSSREVGAQLSYVATSQAAPVADIARRLKAAAAIDLLLTKLIQPPRVDRITIQRAGTDADDAASMTLHLALNNTDLAMSVELTEDEAILYHEPDHKQTTKATRIEIDNHAAAYPRDSLPH